MIQIDKETNSNEGHSSNESIIQSNESNVSTGLDDDQTVST